MPIENVPLDQVIDNPFNPRLRYKQAEIEELAISIRDHGQLETPVGRRHDGKVELAFGGKRMRAFKWLSLNSLKEPDKWATQPIEIRELDDDQMFYFAVEENARRSGNTSIEVARAIDSFLKLYPEKSEREVGERLQIKQSTVSNMRRVLALPASILSKIDDDVINFSMARELLVLKDQPSADVLMTSVLSYLLDGRFLGTVEGIQSAIHEVAEDTFKPLDTAEFNQDGAGCPKCKHKLTTHPSRGKSAHWCMDATCWDLHTRNLAEALAKEEAERKAASAARARKPTGEGTTWIPAKEPGDLARVAPPPPAEHPRKEPSEEEEPKVPCLTCANDAVSCHRERFHAKEVDGTTRFVCESHVDKVPHANIWDTKPGAQGDTTLSPAVGTLAKPPERVRASDESVENAKAEAERIIARNEGRARRTQEHKAIKEALDTVKKSKTIPKSVLMLVLLAQMTGSHIDKNDFYYDGWGKSPEKWLWDKVSSGTEEAKRKPGDLFKKIYKMSDGEIARLATDMMFFYLQDHGGVGAYQIKTKTPLTWFGVDVDKYQEKAPAAASLEEGTKEAGANG